ncbi:MAG: glycosyltransferase [Salibacteraceae bacterium]
MRSFNQCIVIPCFNEASHFLKSDYIQFLENNPNTLICFVNDGSTDETKNIIQELNTHFVANTHLINLPNNVGKAEAVRNGINYCNENYECKVIGFIDADLAVSLEESIEISNKINDKTKFAFGSRILRVGSTIERKFHRFLIGRFLATLISNILNLKVYDTQCGCKMFQPDLSPILFTQPFISTWLFDVELFFRLKKYFGANTFKSHLLEVPLNSWIDRGESKVSFLYGFKVFYDLYKIKMRYK